MWRPPARPARASRADRGGATRPSRSRPRASPSARRLPRPGATWPRTPSARRPGRGRRRPRTSRGRSPPSPGCGPSATRSHRCPSAHRRSRRRPSRRPRPPSSRRRTTPSTSSRDAAGPDGPPEPGAWYPVRRSIPAVGNSPHLRVPVRGDDARRRGRPASMPDDATAGTDQSRSEIVTGRRDVALFLERHGVRRADGQDEAGRAHRGRDDRVDRRARARAEDRARRIARWTAPAARSRRA